MERVLGYDFSGGLISTAGWPEDVVESLASEPELFATAGRESRFGVIRVKLASSGKLSLVAERKVMERLRNNYPYALYVFSDADERLWHFVNAPHGERVANKQYRRLVISPGEELRTATERISMLSVDTLAENSGEEPEDLSPLEIQAAHDEAFDVEAVTREFFREYRRVFEEVEDRVSGIEGEEETRFFVQRLFNRLMFVAFVEKKGWMHLGSAPGRTDYLAALWKAYEDESRAGNGGGGGFYHSRLKPLFFGGFNTENEPGYKDLVIGAVPYLNGGLFEEDAQDKDGRIEVPDQCLREILVGLFSRFNFTTTESTPLDTEVAVDPEMLGKVFEELVTGRHDVGAYYTPKPIVSFMCREALKGHLEKELGASGEGDREAIRAFVEEHDPDGLGDPEGALDALKKIRVCDPACGSGAYLLGMLRELLDLRESLFRTRNIDPRTNYQRKLEIIQNNLYGVDKEEFAVNIARLRLWLSLVVDYEGQSPPPLPNLEFKIEAGDSLMAPDPSGGFEMDMVRDEQVSRLGGLKAGFLKAHGEEKKRLRGEIDALRWEISAWAHPGGAVGGFDWQVEFAEVFAVDDEDGEGGFDVILANPPYVRQELIIEFKPALKTIFPEVYTGTSDLYVFFYARALQLLGRGGMLAFISSNKWFRANYGKKLRKHVAGTTHVASITDFGDLPVFRNATAYPMIFVAQKDRRKDGATVLTQAKTLEPPYPDVAAVVRKIGSPLPPDSLNGAEWSLTDAATAKRLRKMRAAGVPLGEYVNGQIYYGIKTGFNKAFVIDGAKRDELISQDPDSAEIIKRFATGRDVRKWAVDYKDKWLIVTPIGVDMERYPALFDHLRKWQPELERRYDQGKHWWELRSCDYYDAFDQPKVMFPDIAKGLRFALDDNQTYSNNTTYFTPMSDLYMLGVLNSSVIEDFYIELSAQVRGGYLRFFTQYVEQIPIPDAPAADREAIADLVQKCLNAKGVGCEEWEAEIDERVASLYGF